MQTPNWVTGVMFLLLLAALSGCASTSSGSDLAREIVAAAKAEDKSEWAPPLDMAEERKLEVKGFQPQIP